MEQRVLDMTPTDFEMYCRDILSAYAEKENLPNFEITHDKKIRAVDGTYQIDIYATFTALGCDIKMLCECKRYKSPVKREVVSQLHDKLGSVGAHKGMIMSTGGFQTGAIEYSKAHGIALVHVKDRECTFLAHSKDTNAASDDDPFTYSDRHLPPVEALDCTSDDKLLCAFYPTSAMEKAVNEEMERLIRERLGFLYNEHIEK